MLAQRLDDLQAPVLTSGRHPIPLRLVIALTSYEEQAQVIFVGQLHQTCVLPLVWKVMPGHAKWEHGLWASISELFERLAPQLGDVDCTVIGDHPFGCFPMVRCCQEFGWHYLFRVSGQHICAPRSPQGQLLPTVAVSQLRVRPGDHFYGPVRLWRDKQIDTNLSGYWDPEEKEALLVISDRPACAERLSDYRGRLLVEVTFQGPARTGRGGKQRQTPATDHPDAAISGPLVRLSTLEISCLVARETQKFLRHIPFDDRYGLELFYRAIEERDQMAWDCIYAQYSTLVLAWLHRDLRAKALFQRDASSPDALVNAAFARFAHAVTPLKLQGFNQLAGILGYLKCCTRCALHYEVRVWRTQHKLEAEGATLKDLEESSQDPDQSDPSEKVMGTSFAKCLWRLLQYEFTSEEEQIVIYFSFYFGMRPAEIAGEYPHRFPSPKDVSRIKRNVMERLRRDEHLQAAIKRLTTA